MTGVQFKLGLRVADVDAAREFYGGLGFAPIDSVSNPEGRTVLSILELDGVMLIVDALVGLPFPDTARERQIQRGPRGLGVAIGLGVTELDRYYRYCVSTGCTITCEPMDEAWGDRVFECIDPFGYQWELTEPISGAPPADAFEAVRASWFGTSS